MMIPLLSNTSPHIPLTTIPPSLQILISHHLISQTSFPNSDSREEMPLCVPEVFIASSQRLVGIGGKEEERQERE